MAAEKTAIVVDPKAAGDAASKDAKLDFNPDCVGELVEGTKLIKLKGSNGKVRRHFRLKPNYQSIVYEGSTAGCYAFPRSVDVSRVREVRKGYSTDNFNRREKSEKFRKKFPEDRCFSIVLHNGRIMDLVARDKASCHTWTSTLEQLVNQHAKADRETKINGWLRWHFDAADKNVDSYLNLSETITLLHNMNIKARSPAEVRLLFDIAEPTTHPSNNIPVLDYAGFQRLYRLISGRPEIKDIFEEFLSDKSQYLWTLGDLTRFLVERQKEKDVTKETCEALIVGFEPVKENKEAWKLSLDGLVNLLNSPKFLLFDPKRSVVCQDMGNPLTDYFIASSHNSYLMDGQIAGTSSIEAYIACLLKGCRCVEIDCWDGDDGDPIITHGNTMTTSIRFEDVVKVIAEYGFKTSEYPVILSLENHCSIVQQDIMAAYLHTHLKDQLFAGPVGKKALSPNELKNKVLIKAKKLPEEVKEDAEVASDTESPDEVDETVKVTSTPEMKVEEVVEKASKSKETIKLSKRLSDCVFLKATKFGGFANNKNGKYFECSSVSESKIVALLERQRKDIIEHCQRQLVRVYPAATRLSSSNFNALPILEAGCQIVALNYQNLNKNTDAYNALFMDNGGCGYLLKPEFMRIHGWDVDLFEASRRPWMLTVRIISGQRLPKPLGSPHKDVVDPYVTVEVIGREVDEKKMRSAVVKNNGFNPYWNEKMDFRVNYPEMAVLRMKVKDQDNTSHNPTIGQYSIPFSCIQEGFRHVQLLDREDQPLELASIFLEITKLVVP
ncbi:hypothetical protein RvY_18071 [Ramazzottius varieornatus]|uniref:Phosphoinositide phospholipase C n=1 Tax=Ramazzottius varieornatus TaxID=947166 RepID=A0A1D1W693_RAMVA|nr:hypothetical protein RvY_18071 [Ramazzottius varieornatus]